MLNGLMKSNGWFPTMFDDFFNTDFMPRANSTAPAVNVKESEKAYTMELPAKACAGINTAITSITTITIVIFFRITLHILNHYSVIRQFTG